MLRETFITTGMMFITTGICEGSMSTHHVMFTTIFADDKTKA